MENKTIIIAEPGKQEIIITREFEAKRELVFRAFTEPELIVQWLGENAWHIETLEAKNGGVWRYIFDDGARKIKMHGVIHELTLNERLIRTFEVEGLQQKGRVSLEIAKFESIEDERTKLILHCIYTSVEDRDKKNGAIQQGVIKHHKLLDELFIKIKSPK